jgi:hypothetical protein
VWMPSRHCQRSTKTASLGAWPCKWSRRIPMSATRATTSPPVSRCLENTPTWAS